MLFFDVFIFLIEKIYNVWINIDFILYGRISLLWINVFNVYRNISDFLCNYLLLLKKKKTFAEVG